MSQLARACCVVVLSLPWAWCTAWGGETATPAAAAAPVAAPVLRDFVPKYTDSTQSAYFAESGGGKQPLVSHERIVTLVLRGSGFQTGADQDKNLIFINDDHMHVTWGSCQGRKFGTEASPVGNQIFAESVSDEEIHLCGVVVPPHGEIRVKVGLGEKLSDQKSYQVYSMGRTSVTAIAAVVALALALLPLWLLSFLPSSYRISTQDYKLRLLFLDPQTDTYSLSKLQFYLWTVAALFSYAYFFISRVIVQYSDWPDVPATLPGIIAVAAGTSISSQVITISRGSKGAGPVTPGFADLITSGGVVAPDRIQMLLWTLFGVGAFLIAVVEQYPGTMDALPTIPERLVYLMGLSSAGYLGGKLARKPGPVINEFSVIPSEPDETLARAGSLAQSQMPDFSTAILSASGRLAALPRAAGARAQAGVDALSRALSAAKSVQTTSDLNGLWNTLEQLRAAAGDAAEGAAVDFANAPDDAARASRQSDAGLTQSVAALLQDLSADLTSALASAAAVPMAAVTAPPLATRTITLRGTNLSTDEALFEIDHLELPFRILRNSQGNHAPDILVREDSAPTLARIMRLTIEPTTLSDDDLIQFRHWFESPGTHTFTITNGDGQQAEIMFALPPGAGQKTGVSR